MTYHGKYLTAKERRDLEEPAEPGQLSPLWDQEEMDECGAALGVVPVISEVN